MAEDVVVRADQISKNFVLPQEKADSIKSLFTGVTRRGSRKREQVQHALKDISFEIKQGEFFGIVGRNGSGKSTLLKILAGIYQPTSGEIGTTGKLVPFIELGVGFNPELTGRENIYLNGALLGFTKKEIDSMYHDIVEFAELQRFMDQKLKNYSSGMQVRLAFSMAIRAEADILVVDEVLAVGDADFQKKCFRYFRSLKKNKKTVIFVSHDMQAVEEYCDRAILIEKSELVIGGSPREVAMAYTRMFLDESGGSNSLRKSKQRWGTEAVKFSGVTVESAKLQPDDKQIRLSTKATVERAISGEIVFGFKVRAEDDTAILGTNTKLKHHRFENPKKGQMIDIVWEFPNIFNTGRYFVDVAIQRDDYEKVYDWWEGAASFSVERDEDNSYPIHPPIEVSVVNGGELGE